MTFRLLMTQIFVFIPYKMLTGYVNGEDNILLKRLKQLTNTSDVNCLISICYELNKGKKHHSQDEKYKLRGIMP